MRLSVRLTPRGGRNRVDRVVDGVLRARVSAPPVDGEANEALVALLAHELDVPRGAVRIVAGATSRVKTVAVEGITAAALEARWPGLAR